MAWSETLSPWRPLFILLLYITGQSVGSQHNDNVYVSGQTTGCGQTVQMVSNSGVITSPGWPFKYPDGVNCSWNIRAPPGDVITISFQDFELQMSHRCGSDWLSVGSYKNLDAFRVCGSSLPAPFISSLDVWIQFHSDRSLTAKGFRLIYVTGKLGESSCLSDQFHCSSGKCIPLSWRCNSQDECGDNSDEELCGDLSQPAADAFHQSQPSDDANLDQSQRAAAAFDQSQPSAAFSFQPCAYNQFPCLSRYTRLYTCLPASLKCDGSIDCQDLGDEIDCDVPSCGERLKNFYGSFSSPNYPDFYPPGSNCTWTIDTGDHRKVILRFIDFKLDGTGYGDYVKVYDGLEASPRRLLRVLTAFDSRAPLSVVSSAGQLTIHFYADKINAARGFNVTYQVDGFCLPWEVPCGGNWGCYTEQQRCDGYWHCPNGRDETNCSSCQEEEFPCSRNGACYPRSDRCNYQNRCPNGSDEKNCFFCQPGNFHCKNNRCVFESWVCDAQDDCGDGSDEDNCPVIVPTRVITAAVIGSLICGLLLVIALGCTCKLYSLRMFERRSFETQLSRVEAELLRREAPPSYGQLIAQGLIPPVEDFPVCSGNQASVLENLRLAVRSQLGFTSLRLPSSSSSSRRGGGGNLWRRLFRLSRSRRSGSLALVSSGDPEDGTGTGTGVTTTTSGTGSRRGPLPLDSDDTDTESDRGGARDGERGGGGGGGAASSVGGGPVAPGPLPVKTPPAVAVEANIVSVTSSSTAATTIRDPAGSSPVTAVGPAVAPSPRGGPASSDVTATGHSSSSQLHHTASGGGGQLSSALGRLARSLAWARCRLNRPVQNHSHVQQNTSSPLRHLVDSGGSASAGSERRSSRDDEDDVELLIPDSDSASSSSGGVAEVCRPLLPRPASSSSSSSLGHTPQRHHHHHHHHQHRRGSNRDGPCERCGKVHTAQIPQQCLEAASSDDELLLLC